MKLMVLDGNSIVNRAYYGVGKARLLTTRQGLHTNAIYGFVTMLQKLLDQEKPDAVCAAFDRREPTFRPTRPIRPTERVCPRNWPNRCCR